MVEELTVGLGVEVGQVAAQALAERGLGRRAGRRQHRRDLRVAVAPRDLERGAADDAASVFLRAERDERAGGLELAGLAGFV